MAVTQHRVFFAVRPENLSDLVPVWEQARVRGWRTVPVENAHVTLLFLGLLDDLGLSRAMRAASSVKADRFHLRLDRSGCWRRSRVLWLAPSDRPEALLALVERLHCALGDSGIALPRSPYRPHLTVSRHAASARGFETGPVEWDVRRFFLMESHPGATGVRYSPLWEFALA